MLIYCQRCNAVRAPMLAIVAPCEQCGASAPECVVKTSEPTEPGWELKDLGRRRIVRVVRGLKS